MSDSQQSPAGGNENNHSGNDCSHFTNGPRLVLVIECWQNNADAIELLSRIRVPVLACGESLAVVREWANTLEDTRVSTGEEVQ